MDGDISPSPLNQRAKFEIDLKELGTFLAEAFIRRVDAFVPADRIILLQACRVRLAGEGGDIVRYLLDGLQDEPCHSSDANRL